MKIKIEEQDQKQIVILSSETRSREMSVILLSVA